ncbi:hypothetical protein CPM_0909 [Cuniculiplasma divulgatum]|uniref:Uncharacterized protein n=1 Tax=Cuniculiplasma divulgatum TaxID=1673428 RepID=A0A1R4A6Z7_9ARCH|nr:hypothetical protein CPM_0909 [Cuniculiplasma divulgatum]
MLSGGKMARLPHILHFHQGKDGMIRGYTTPKALCPFCEREWKQEGYRKVYLRYRKHLRRITA